MKKHWKIILGSGAVVMSAMALFLLPPSGSSANVCQDTACHEFISLSASAASVPIATSTTTGTTGWVYANDGSIYYRDTDGSYLTGVQEIDGVPYWFYTDGTLHTGWQTVQQKRYFYDPVTGQAQFGWIHQNGRCFYVSQETGKLTGLQQVEEEYYPFSATGAVMQGFCQLPNGDARYYYNDGSYQKGFFSYQGATYYFDVDGIMLHGWHIIEDARYYFDENGVMATDRTEINGRTYFFKSTGEQLFGQQIWHDQRYYLDELSGAMMTGWVEIDGEPHYFLPESGVAAQEWTTIDDKTYYFLTDGTYATGWQTLHDNTYYFYANGVCASGATEINGVTYYFDKDSFILLHDLPQDGELTSEEKDSHMISAVPSVADKNYPTGAESICAVMLLQNAGYDISVQEFIDNHLNVGYLYKENGVLYGPHPSEAFIGDPTSRYGYGCYAPVIVHALNQVLTDVDTAVDLTDTDFSTLLTDYINHDIPIAIWATMNMIDTHDGTQWIVAKTGETYTWKQNEHCLVLIGYDTEYYYFHDPFQKETVISYERELVETRFREMGCQAVAILTTEKEA